MVLWCQRSQHFAIAAGEVGGFSICACHPCAFNLTTMSKHNAPLVCYRRGSNIEETGAHWWAISSLPVRSNRPPAAPRLCKEARAVEVVTRRWASELTEDPRRSYGAAPVPPVPRRGQGWAAELLLVWPSCAVRSAQTHVHSGTLRGGVRARLLK